LDLKLAPKIVGHCNESIDQLLGGGDDLIWGKDESISASITEFESVSQGGVMDSLDPVNTSSRSYVQDINNVSGGVTGAELLGNGCLHQTSNPHVVIVIGNMGPAIDVGSVGDEDELAVTVKTDVCPGTVGNLVVIIGKGLGFGFREGTNSHVSVRGAHSTGTSGVPLEREVPVGIGSSANASGEVGTCLSPHPVGVPGVFIAIRVDAGGNMEVISVQQTLDAIVGSIQQLVDDVSGDSVGDPFSGMDIGINEDYWPLAVSNLDQLKVPTLKGSSVGFN